MTTLKELLSKTTRNLYILQEREAKYGGDAPLKLLNQIGDHEQAIELITEALAYELTEADLQELKETLRPLLLADNVEAIDVETLKIENPPLPFEPETVFIPAGAFIMGGAEGEHVQGWETPQHEIILPPYQIGKYPVTNEQYAAFISQAKHPPPKKTGWFGTKPPSKKLDHPVVGVSWYDALAYCRWLSEQTDRVYRLPSEAEWEKAARGEDGRVFPWGNEWDAARCNCANIQTTPVTAYPSGQSPYGCYDMLGNIWEWTTTLWGSDWKISDFEYPYRADDGRENLEAASNVYRVFRGGSFADKTTDLRCSARRWYAPDHADKRRGFRAVLEVRS
jgi:formylglycine-generating enzyme required for sulfatase activity